MVFKEKTLTVGGQGYVLWLLLSMIQNISGGEIGRREEKEQGWSVFGDKGPETSLSLLIKQHTSAVVMIRAL